MHNGTVGARGPWKSLLEIANREGSVKDPTAKIVNSYLRAIDEKRKAEMELDFDENICKVTTQNDASNSLKSDLDVQKEANSRFLTQYTALLNLVDLNQDLEKDMIGEGRIIEVDNSRSKKTNPM